jgi:hypothetical protein
MDKEKFIGGYDSTRKGDKGDKKKHCILFTHLELVGKSGYVRFLGKPHGALWECIF